MERREQQYGPQFAAGQPKATNKSHETPNNAKKDVRERHGVKKEHDGPRQLHHRAQSHQEDESARQGFGWIVFVTLDSFFFPFPVINKMSTLFLTKYKLNMLVNLANPGLVISVSTACRYKLY